MAKVYIPQKEQPKQNQGGGVNSILQIGGAILGGLTGGLPGAAAGANLGSMLGGAVNPPESPEPVKQTQGVESAMSRRVAQLDQTPLKQIRDSIDSLKYVDPSIRAELAKPLLQAEYLAKQEA